MLTGREYKAWALVSLGFSADEGADKMNICVNTFRKHVDNAKKKIGKGKATELTATFICQFYGDSYENFKKKVLTAVLFGFLIISINPADVQQNYIRNRRSQRMQVTRVVRITRRESGSLYEVLPKVV